MKKPFGIVSITMVRNERDVIEPFVRHNLRFVDYMIVIDNNSTDDTRDILVQLARETGRVGVFDRKKSNFTQGEFITRIMQSLQPIYFADFFVFLDGDEFIGAESPDAFRRALETIPQFGFGLMPWRTYVLPEGEDMDAMTANPPASMTWCRVQEGEQHYKVVLRTDGKILRDYHISNGNHIVTRDEGGRLPSVRLNEVPLLHFPVRSLEQLTVKSINGWMAIRAIQASGVVLGRNECHQWRENFERAMAGTLDSELSKASYFYSRPSGTVDWEQDVTETDHGIAFERKYSDGRYGEVLRLVGKAWEATYDGVPPVLPERFRSDFLKVVGGETVNPKVIETVDPELVARTALDVPFLRWVHDYASPSLVLEVGCGFGANLLMFRHFGVEGIVGLDDRSEAEVFLRGNAFSRRKPEDFRGTVNPLDMTLCLGALDGMDQGVAIKVASAMARSTNGHIIFLPGAITGGESKGPLSLRQWLSVWRQLGWVPDIAATLAGRAVATVPALRRGALILRKAAEGDGDHDDFLVWVSRLPHQTEVAPGHLFEEPFSEQAVRYGTMFRPGTKRKG
jgi:SAM-dependent methyltransferase